MMAADITTISTAEAFARLRSMPFCQVTANQPTRMVRETFMAMCRKMATVKTAFGDKVHTYCRICGGKKLPAGLEFITIEEVVMGDTKELDTCAACGKEKTLRIHLGEYVCASCQIVRIACKNNPEIVLRQLEKFGVEVAGDKFAAVREEAMTKEIAEGKAAIDKLTEERDWLRQVGDLQVQKLEEEESKLDQLQQEFVALDAEHTKLGLERDAMANKIREWAEQQDQASHNTVQVNGHAASLHGLAWSLAESIATGKPVACDWSDVTLLRELAGA